MEAVEQTDWGESEIRGSVHLFRERLLMRLFRRLSIRIDSFYRTVTHVSDQQ